MIAIFQFVKWYDIVVLTGIPLMVSDIEHKYLLVICISSEKFVCSSSAKFVIGMLVVIVIIIFAVFFFC